MVRGHGSDLVVLEAGLGLSGLYWGPVHELVGKRARVVAYERAGFGSSSPDDHPRSLARVASDLEAVINAYPHRRLVLVGHSWGGPIIRFLAARRIDQNLPVNGLVLVDQSDENASLYFAASARYLFATQSALMVPLARLSLLAPLSRSLVRGLDDPLLHAVVSSSTSLAAARAAVAEQRHLIEGLRGLKEAPPTLGDLPISVISGQKRTRLDAKTRASIMQAHRQTAGQYSGARFVPAEHSDHMIPTTEPALVASEALSFFQ